MGDEADARFAEWFRKNYPGPDTIIHKPDWHAPKILRAAVAALEAPDAETARLSALMAERDEARKEAGIQMRHLKVLEGSLFTAEAEAATLRDRLARMEGESEGWKKAFAAQSNKLQKVLHIPGVRAALTDGGSNG